MEAPLPRALLLVSEEVRQKMEKLFDVAYMVAKLDRKLEHRLGYQVMPVG